MEQYGPYPMYLCAVDTFTYEVLMYVQSVNPPVKF